ncbi:MAG: pyruvate:ferredoxin (flavodoxin) oxidoreductase, partial [Acidimicrobiia bacterium]|nr:pyruvate:ferredoxin (flavodoxin) oxidoreductase [Acidimicrobiia bacterium]
MSAARKGAVLQLVVDGNEAAARVAHALSEVVAIYPITPASPMGELSEAWSARGQTNVWGGVPDIIEMQSEGGAAGALHGALQSGALATTFTASQGLLLMIPNMYKIAGELTPTVIHVAARAVATHALSIFGDHSDVMATRQTGFAMLASSSVQEAQDLAAVAHAATLASRVPFLHFFDGFRTSHEINKIDGVTTDQLRSLIDQRVVDEHRARALNPNHPVLRGSAQNPDVFFQAREAINSYYDVTPQIVQRQMDRFASLTGRRYRLFDYFGHPEPEHVVVVMGSGAGALREAVDHLLATTDRRVGVLVVRLYRPFDSDGFRDALPRSVKRLCVLDRTKEPGAPGEPLFLDVAVALADAQIEVTRGRFGLGSKEFTPQMAIAVFDNLAASTPRSPVTLGIVDDVTRLSLPADDAAWSEPDDVVRAVFFGLGSDGTVGANKATAKIIGDSTDLNVQAYFVYDSKKSGSQTVSHLRFGPEPIMSTHLIKQATFVAIHQFSLLKRSDILDVAAPGATLLLNSPFGPEDVWDRLEASVRQAILDKGLDLWVIDATRVATEAGLGGRINTVLQTCFFALANVLPRDVAIDKIKQSTAALYAKRGDVVVRRNLEAIDAALGALHRAVLPSETTGSDGAGPPAHSEPNGFVERVTSQLLAGRGDLLPVSAMPVDGTFPTGTAKYERRSIATEIPIWDPEICIDCARCALVCPHAAIRFNVFEPDALSDAPAGFLSKSGGGRDTSDKRVVVQVAPDDCTGCGVCVDICPARSKENTSHKAIDMTPKDEFLERERTNFEYFLSL